MKHGSPAGSLQVLSGANVERIHQASLALLQDPGIHSSSDLFLDILARGGACVDRAARVIHVPPGMVEAALKLAPKSFTVYGLHPEMDLLVEQGRVYYGAGGTSEPYFYDYALGRPRRPAKADMVAGTRLAEALPNIDFVMAMCSSGDVPADKVFFHDTDAILRNTTKPTHISVVGRRATRQCLEMVAAASGGETAFRRRPRGMAMVSAVSPLRVTGLNEGIVDVIEFGVPVLYGNGPLLGTTCPVTLAGALALSMAECLFGLVLVQLIRPGAPVIWSPNTNAMDPTIWQNTYGSPEQALGKAAMAQMGRFYGMPTFTMGGGVEAKCPDPHAAAEAMLGMLLNSLAGVTLSQSLGTLSSGAYGSLEFLMISDEMAHMVKRILNGMAVNEDTLGLDVIRSVGHFGNFMTEEHTLRHFKHELFFPQLFRRDTIENWVNRGAHSIVEVAHERVEQILAHAGPVTLPAGADGELEQKLREAMQ